MDTPTAVATAAIPSGQAEQTLLLDSDIRDWVVLPLLVIMIAAGLLRHFMGILMKAQPKPMNLLEQRSKSTLTKVFALKTGTANYISSSKWEARRQYYAARDEGYLREEADWAQDYVAENPGSGSGGVDPANPMAMMDGMKGSMAFMIQNMVMMQGIQYFFKGFILLKVPFPLTRGFKNMFQRGLLDPMSTLDTSYVSSVSWYFLVMYGLRGFFSMVIGNPSQEQLESDQMQNKMGMSVPAAGPSQQFDAPKLLNQEADNLELLPSHKSELDSVEKRLLGKKYPKKKVLVKDDLYGYGSVSKSSKKKSH